MKYIGIFKEHPNYKRYYDKYLYKSNKNRTNVSLCKKQKELHYAPWELDYAEYIECIYYIEESGYTQLYYDLDGIDFIIIDGEIQDTIQKTFYLENGYHTVKFLLDGYIDYIKPAAFFQIYDLYNVNICSSTIKYLNAQSFYACENLTTISLCDSIEYIDESVFEYCYQLNTINIPNNIKYIGD